MSKARTQDDTLEIGVTDPNRAWLQELCPALKKMSRKTPLLLDMPVSTYLLLFRRAVKTLNEGHIHPHQLRHGGASADGALKVPELTMLMRGRWAARNSLLRYMKPAQYLRQLEKFTTSALKHVEKTVVRLRKELPTALRAA